MAKQSNFGDFVGTSLDLSDYTSLEEKLKMVEQAEKEGKNVREIEKILFKPKDITGVFDTTSEKIIPEAVKVYFKDPRYYILFLKYFKVSEYIEYNLHRIEPLILFLLLLENKFIEKEDIGNVVKFKFNCKEAVFNRTEL